MTLPDLTYRQQADVCGEYLHRHEWHFKIDLTTAGKDAISPDRFLELVLEWVRWVGRRFRVKCRPFILIEGSTTTIDKRTHAHVLLWGPVDATVDEIRDKWPHGFATVKRYDPAQDAAEYVSECFPLLRTRFHLPERMPPLLVRSIEQARSAIPGDRDAWGA